MTKTFMRIFFTLPEVFSAGTFHAVHKILRKQLPSKVLPRNMNPWKHPQETGFLRKVQRYPQVIPLENREFLVVERSQMRSEHRQTLPIRS